MRCYRYEPFVCCGCLDDLPWRATLLEQPRPPFTSLAAPFDYAFPVDAALKALKFRRRLDYVPAFANLLHWRRHARRGFNQALVLCRELASQSGWPLLGHVRRVRATRYQSGLLAQARQHNLRGAFIAHGRIDARHVLLVDDVITTGATCEALAATTLAAGAKKVSVLAVARS